ncbi:MAG: NAD(P)-binding domain-containing protein [Arcobacter sp.]|nr:NAD(P)-binding domain-containing protein [Arcobacter sp.]
MHRVVILGSGNIGFTVALFLKESNDYDITVISRDKNKLFYLKSQINIKVIQCNLEKKKTFNNLIKDFDTVISALPFYLNIKVAKAALEAGINYFDFTEDVKTTNTIKEISKKANSSQVFVPQCGLAPGFISILANSLVKQFEQVHSIKMRVGALPKNPSNKILYNLTWSTDGLINEYSNECFAIKNSKLIKVQPLEGLENFSLDGLEYEAFNTSGGLGTLCETLKGKVKELNYKTIRYIGHRDYMDFLINDLYLGKKKRRKILKEILEYAIPTTKEDVVLIFCSVTGVRHGKLEQVTNVRKIYNNVFNNQELSSIQITTASALCTILDLFINKKIKRKGFIKQEDIDINDFLSNRFGKEYI